MRVDGPRRQCVLARARAAGGCRTSARGRGTCPASSRAAGRCRTAVRGRGKLGVRLLFAGRRLPGTHLENRNLAWVLGQVLGSRASVPPTGVGLPECPTSQGDAQRKPLQIAVFVGRAVAGLWQAAASVRPGVSAPPCGCRRWRGQDSNLRRQSQSVYSRSPLTTRTPRRVRSCSLEGPLWRSVQPWVHHAAARRAPTSACAGGAGDVGGENMGTPRGAGSVHRGPSWRPRKARTSGGLVRREAVREAVQEASLRRPRAAVGPRAAFGAS